MRFLRFFAVAILPFCVLQLVLNVSLEINTSASQPMLSSQLDSPNSIQADQAGVINASTSHGVDVGSKPRLTVVQQSQKVQPIGAVDSDSQNVDTVSTPLDTTEKPLFVLHVGPPKTGTSTIQWLAAHHEDKLRKNNIYFLGHGASKRNLHQLHYVCTENGLKDMELCDEKWGAFSRTVEYHLDRNHTVFVSEELAGAMLMVRSGDAESDVKRRELLWDQYLLPLLQEFDVRVVFAYRHYFDWLVSKYLEKQNPTLVGRSVPALRITRRERWPGMGGRTVLSFPQWLNKVWEDSGSDGSYAVQYQPLLLKKWWDDRFDDVRIFNMHDKGDMVRNFYCQMIPEARELCDFLSTSQSLEATENRNPSSSKHPHFDLIAVEAFQRGWINNTFIRTQAVERIEAFAKSELNFTTPTDLPLTCLSDNQTEQLLEKSLEMERAMVPSFHASPLGEQELRTRFAHAVKGKKFCSVHVEKTFEEDERWKRFFNKTMV